MVSFLSRSFHYFNGEPFHSLDITLVFVHLHSLRLETHMLNTNLFVVTPKTKLFSSKVSFEIRDEHGQVIGTADQTTSLLAQVIGMVKGPPSTRIGVLQKPDDSLVFAVRRSGFLFKKVETVDEQGEVIARYKKKGLSLSGGYHVYDKSGKHIAEIRGKLFKAEYTVFAPDGKTEMGKVSRKWGGMMKELLSANGTYGVQIAPPFAEDQQTKIMILGAAIALDSLLKTHVKGSKGEAESEGSTEE